MISLSKIILLFHHIDYKST